MAYGLTQSLDLESGSSQYVSIADGSQTGLEPGSEITLEGWFNFESTPSSGNQATLLAKDNGASRSYQFMYQNNGGTLRFVVGIGVSGAASMGFLTQNYTLSTGVWYHLAATYVESTNTAVFYVGGTSVGSGTLDDTGVLPPSTAPFTIGTRIVSGTPTNFFDGKVSLCRVWSVARSGADIAANICNVYGTSTSNMAAEWSFNNVYTDASGNSNTLTPSGSPVFATDVPAVCAVVGPTNVKTWDGVTQSTGVKTYFGVAVASVKSVNGVN